MKQVFFFGLQGANKMAFQKRLFIFFWVIAVWVCVLSVYPALSEEMVIIVNKGVFTHSMEKEALRDIFLGNTSVWPESTKVNFAILVGDSETHKIFVRVITRKTESQFQAWWKRKLFTGTGKMPYRVKTDQEMIDYVANTEGGLGYVSSGASIPNIVKILTVTDDKGDAP